MNYRHEKIKSLLRKIYNFIKAYIKYEKIKRKKSNRVNYKKALVIKCSNPYIFHRHFYTLLKFFSLEGFDIYFPVFNYQIFRKSFKIPYFRLIYEERLIIFGRIPRKYEIVLELNDNNLCPDYFTSIMQNDRNNTLHIPMTMHPLFYHRQYWNKLAESAKKRKKSIFMAGNFDRKAYSIFSDGPFNIESRIEVYDYLQENQMLTQIKSFHDLKILLNNNKDNILIIIHSFCVNMNQLREIIGHFYFYLALPGVVIPFSHNLTEALSVGAIPIIHREYAKLMAPSLEHMNNAILYNNMNDISAKIELAYNLNEENLFRLKDNASRYYKENLTPKSVINKIISKKYDLFYLLGTGD